MAGTDPAFPRPGSTTPISAPSAAASSVVVDSGVDPLLGLNLSGFVVKQLVAAGGMGLVYLAEHETIGRRAAVKVLKPEVAADQEWTRRFLTEARALASLKHRNLIEVLNFGKTPDGRQFLMMEFLEGEPLDAYIKRVGALSAAVALGIADQVLNGLAEAHKKGVVHRDLKPSNVFLLREHNGELLVKVIDFGLARQEPIALVDAAVALLPRTNDGASLLAGTPEYIAPEQAQGLKVDGGADLYSLGVMLFEMLAGQLPFESSNVSQLLQKHLSERPPHLSSLVNNLVEGLEEFVESLLEKDPGSRPSSADAARVTVQRLLKRLSADSTAVRQMPVEPKQLPTMKIDRPTMPAQSSTARELGAAFPQRSRRGTAVAAAAVVAVALLAWWLWPRDAAPVKAAVVPPPVVVVQPVAEAPPVAAQQPVVTDAQPPTVKPPDEDLAPMPRLKVDVSPVAAVTPKKPKAGTKYVVEAAGCVPDAEWRKRVRDELSALSGWAAQNRQSEKFEQLERGTAGYMQASGPSECVRVMTALHDIRAAFGLPDE